MLDGSRLVDMARVGATVISPDGSLACFEVRQYDWAAKKFDAQLWIADLQTAAGMNEAELAAHAHLTLLTAGSQHGFTSAFSPQFSPCGKHIAFLSDRGGDKTNGTAVWITPATGPGEARLLASFPVAVGDLEWNHDSSGIVVSASVYVDEAARGASGLAAMESTAARDKALKEDESGLNAVIFKRLPIRQWDSWLTSAMPHPFFAKVVPDAKSPSGYKLADVPAVDLLSAVPTAVPSGAFGGSEDWAISKGGAVAVSARPPLASDEAWTTNRHIYLQRTIPDGSGAWDGDLAAPLGECLTQGNPGYDTTPTFSPDGTKLAWLTMAGAEYESDAVGIMLHDLVSGETRTLLKAEEHFDHSPRTLRWSNDGARLLFVADIRSRASLCSIDAAKGAGPGGEGVTVLTSEGSHALHGECGSGSLLVSSQSFMAPPELYLLSADGSSARQITFFNRERLSETALGRVGEITCEGPSGDAIQSWLIRPAGLSEEEEASPSRKAPLAVIYHGGPQGSTGDDWQFRWNLQSYASAGFAVLGVNFRGSTGEPTPTVAPRTAHRTPAPTAPSKPTRSLRPQALATDSAAPFPPLGPTPSAGTSAAKTRSRRWRTCSRRTAIGSTRTASSASAPRTAASRRTGSTATRPAGSSRRSCVTAAPSTSAARTSRPRSSSSWSTSLAARRLSRPPRTRAVRTCAARRRPRWTSGRRPLVRGPSPPLPWAPLLKPHERDRLPSAPSPRPPQSSSTAPRTFGSWSRRASPLLRRCSGAACRARCCISPARTTTA